jgi:hypothetical protein
LESADPLQGEWGKKIGGAVDSLNELIDKARAHQASRGEDARPLQYDEGK